MKANSAIKWEDAIMEISQRVKQKKIKEAKGRMKRKTGDEVKRSNIQKRKKKQRIKINELIQEIYQTERHKLID